MILLSIQYISFIGLPTVFNIFAHSVPVEERSRAFGYLVASGTVGQTIAALVSEIVILYTYSNMGWLSGQLFLFLGGGGKGSNFLY